jgi:hypothetical protein
MPLKTWAPYDRLVAEDLNAAMAYASGQGLLPGAVCRVPGAPATIANTSNALMNLGAPPAGSDPLGYYVAPDTIRVPVGLAGLHLLWANCSSSAPVGTSSAAGWWGQVDTRT